MKKIFATLILGTAVTLHIFASEPVRTAYFLDGYDFGHRLNPAIQSPRSYIALPVLGSTSLGIRSNLGISTFLYPSGDGRLVTFMNGSVSGEEFLKRLNKNNNVNADFSTGLLSLGFRGERGFTSVEANFKGSIGANLPRDLFAFAKNVGAAENYDISHIGMRGNAYIELAVGHSHKIGDRFTAGVKVKALFGGMDGRMDIENMKIRMAADEWSITSGGGSIRLSAPDGIQVPTYSESGNTPPAGGNGDMLDFSAFEFDFDPVEAFRRNGIKSFLGGFGAALDLGVSYELIDGLTLSASVLDLGFIKWKTALSARPSDKMWSFKGFDDISLDKDSENDLQQQFDHLFDDFSDMLMMQRNADERDGYVSALAATVSVGAEYELPFWRDLSVGGLFTSKMDGAYSWNEGRASLNLALGNWFGLSGSYALSTFGSGFGAAANLHSRIFSLYIGADSILARFTKPVIGDVVGLPVDHLNFGVHFGLVINLSRYKG